nr:MAG TPA: PGDYG protein [Caudoviricetes sp.]
MVKVRKVPVVVDAVRTDTEMYIDTLEGVMKASPGDWIITGVDGEKYPVKPDIFQKTYEILK